MNDIAVIHLRGKRGGFAIVDSDMYEELNKRSWRLTKNGYVVTSVYDPATQKTDPVALHCFVNGTPKGSDTDHANGYKIDNRRRNLRDSTRSQNNANAGCRGKKATPFKGVFWHKRAARWMAAIGQNGKLVYLGLFDDDRTAAAAYNAAAVERFGPFAKLNTFLGRDLSAFSGVAGSRRQA